MNKTARILFIAAIVLALAASLYIIFSPITIAQVDAVSGEETTRQISWFEGPGWWGMLIIALFTALYGLPLWLYARYGGGWAIGAVALTLVITFLAGTSIGIVYWPAAAALLLGIGFIIFQG